MSVVSVSRTIAAAPGPVFERATDIARWPELIGAIKRVELVSGSEAALGTRFRETREMFGREATEEMEIVAFDPPSSYALAAESHGARYLSTFTFEPVAEGTRVTLHFEAKPLTFLARVMSVLTRPMLKSMVKACAADLDDLARSIEAAPARRGERGGDEPARA